MNMSARSKLETFEEVYNRKLTAAEAYANRPRKWMLYTLIVLIIAVMVSWSSSSIQFNGMTTTGSEVAKGVLHGVFHPDTALLFGTGDTDVPYLLLQTVAIAVLGTLFGAILAIPFAFLAASNIMPKPISYLFRLLISKMYITAIEDLDTHILESLDAMGCNAFEKIRYGVIPQLTASFISTTIYRFDINLKDATTLGIVGAGGIGASLVQCLNSRRWAMVGSFGWGLMVLALVIEFFSTRIRRKLAHGQ